MITSATARDPAIQYAIPPGILRDADAAEQWVMSLPAGPRAALQSRLVAIFKGLPPAAQLAIHRSVIAAGHIPPVSPAALDGLGQWGSIITGIAQIGAQVGTTLYTTRLNANLQEDLQSNALAQNAQIAAARLEAEKETQLALLDAQTAAAKMAAAASLQAGATSAAAWTSRLPYIAAGVAVLGIGAMLILRRKKR